ncbi:alkaline ceramidase 1 [Elgaria multicarinata webbii]|uniref:alkaline ceramidase 1 n=1 Tax=Elgaria multicarinata webbii TaxID=159646 RepID=UPI002FCCDC82
MPSIFAYQSAEVDWCEKNFEKSEYIAEYYNTFSSISFFIMAPLTFWINIDYDKYRPFALRTNILLQILIGIFSIYFHLTLSYAGQMLDELSILWTLSISYGFWFPVHHFPRFIKNREQFLWMVGFVTVVSTLMSFVKPVLNAYVLNCITLHIFYTMFKEQQKNKNPRVCIVAKRLVVWWLVAISFWLIDKFLCNLCLKFNFYYFHSLWHILMSVAVCYCLVLILYYDVLSDVPSYEPELQYWPSDTSFFTLPCVKIRNSQKLC